MDLQRYRLCVAGINYGKKLPDALYLFRPREHDVPLEVSDIISRAEVAARPDPSWNLLKLHTEEVAVTFLSYPNFDEDPHPPLSQATKINLNSGSIIRTDYKSRSNPPILHRKEAFLPPSDRRIVDFAALTKREEEAGLYRDPSRIGLRAQWLTLL